MLIGNASARGVEVDINALFFKLCLELEISVIGFLLNLNVVADGVCHMYGLEISFPIVGELVRLVDKRHIVDAVGLCRIDRCRCCCLA